MKATFQRVSKWGSPILPYDAFFICDWPQNAWGEAAPHLPQGLSILCYTIL